MLTRTFPRLGWKVGVIGFGTWGIGGQWGPVEKEAALGAVDAALDAGVNFFDTADAYGELPGASERFLAQALRGRRDEVLIATKVGNFAKRQGHPLPFTHWLHVDLCCDASLHRLQTDHIDLYQCHIPDCENPDVYLEAFDRLTDRGKIRAFGISTNRLDVAQAFNRHDRCAAVQLDYSYVSREPERDLLPYCQEQGLATIFRRPLAQGIATGKFTPQTTFDDDVRRGWNEGAGRARFLQQLDVTERVRAVASPDRTLAQTALRFTISHPAATVAIPGAKDAEQARQNAAAGEAVLPPEEFDAICQASRPELEASA